MKINELKRGSVVHCDFLAGAQRTLLLTSRLPMPWRFLALLGLVPSPSHSGIYLGEPTKKIVSIKNEKGMGVVVAETPEEFLRMVAKINRKIYAAHINGVCVSFPCAADNAEKRVGEKYKYDIISNNCHKFMCACVRGDFAGEYDIQHIDKRKRFLLSDVAKEVRSKATHADTGRSKVKWCSVKLGA